MRCRFCRTFGGHRAPVLIFSWPAFYSMTRGFSIAATLILVMATLVGGFYTRSSRRRQAANANANSQAASIAEDKYQADKIQADYSEAIEVVEQNYAGDIDYEKATQAAIQGMLFTLDPHSVYFPSNEFR